MKIVLHYDCCISFVHFIEGAAAPSRVGAVVFFVFPNLSQRLSGGHYFCLYRLVMWQRLFNFCRVCTLSTGQGVDSYCCGQLVSTFSPFVLVHKRFTNACVTSECLLILLNTYRYSPTTAVVMIASPRLRYTVTNEKLRKFKFCKLLFL